jgi:hypothetical protein
MSMFRAACAAAAMFIGGIAAFLGVVLMISALKTGSIALTYSAGAQTISETASRVTDAARYWRLFVGLGVAPALLGLIAARWGWRAINRRQ